MVCIALCQTVQPLLRIRGAVIVGDNSVKGAILFALEADIVAGRADELASDDNLCRLRAHITLIAVEVLGCRMNLRLRGLHIGQRLHEGIRIGDLGSQHRKM